MPYRLHAWRIVAAVLLPVALWAGCGDARQPEAPAEHTARLAAYESLLTHTPDSLLKALAPLDSFFLQYDPAALRRPTYDSAGATRWVDSTLAALSLDEKIGQLFIVNFPAGRNSRFAESKAKALVEKYGVGGFLMSRLMGPREVFDATQRLQRAAAVPLFFAADYERGVGRFNNALTELPSNMALGATRDTAFAAAAGRLSAVEARATGINLLFAPVVDVNNNPDNPIINIRSYGEDPALVGQMAGSFVREAQRHGVLTTLKHFPGHGNTSVDSHSRMGVVSGDPAALDSVELAPYRLVLAGPTAPAAVMSAHLWIEGYDRQPRPATFSRRVLRDVLRDSLGFEGFVVTDDVKMGALQNRYDVAERTVRPIEAGADVVLTPADVETSINAVKAALRSGRLTEADLNASVRRVLHAKARAGLHRDRFAEAKVLDFLLEAPRGAYLAQAIADQAVTLLKTGPLLPVRSSQKIALVQLTNYRGSASIGAAMDYFAKGLADSYVRHLRLDHDPSAATTAAVLRDADAADVVVLALYLRLTAGRGKAGLFPGQEGLVRRLLERGTPLVLVTFGNPYAVMPFDGADGLLVAYDQTLETVHAATRILLGRQPPQGRLPITVGAYGYGSGLTALAPTPLTPRPEAAMGRSREWE